MDKERLNKLKEIFESVDLKLKEERGWGGYRAGSGRKPKNRVVFSCYLPREIIEKIKNEAIAKKISIGEVVEKRLGF